jgi:uncharacterized protein (TIGR02246 family)
VNGSLRCLAICVVAIVATRPASAAAQSRDELDIRATATRQADAWNQHDAKAYAALFTDDCDVVNVVGWWWKGRAELERKLTEAFRFVFAESKLTIGAVQVRFLSPEIALAHVRWTMVGARTPAGLPEPREGIQTLVLTKRTGHWLISGFQNTHSVPERPFPTGPGPADKP